MVEIESSAQNNASKNGGDNWQKNFNMTIYM